MKKKKNNEYLRQGTEGVEDKERQIMGTRILPNLVSKNIFLTFLFIFGQTNA